MVIPEQCVVGPKQDIYIFIVTLSVFVITIFDFQMLKVKRRERCYIQEHAPDAKIYIIIKGFFDVYIYLDVDNEGQFMSDVFMMNIIISRTIHSCGQFPVFPTLI